MGPHTPLAPTLMHPMTTLSEEWFVRYSRETGHVGWDQPEPDLGIARRPDLLISKGGAQAICEVKEFEDGALERRTVWTLLVGARHKALGIASEPA
jgi:hypothetical protein